MDSEHLLVTGGSQGGAIAMAVAALVPDLRGAMIDVPFLSDIVRAMTITDADPYAELVRYLRVRRADADAVLRTLSYVDGVNMARRASAPALFSVALMDPICPPSTVYAAFNAYAHADKAIVEYPWNQHEGGQLDHEAVSWLGRSSELAPSRLTLVRGEPPDRVGKPFVGPGPTRVRHLTCGVVSLCPHQRSPCHPQGGGCSRSNYALTCGSMERNGAPSGIRTHTGSGLSRTPLPVGLSGPCSRIPGAASRAEVAGGRAHRASTAIGRVASHYSVHVSTDAKPDPTQAALDLTSTVGCGGADARPGARRSPRGGGRGRGAHPHGRRRDAARRGLRRGR